MARHSVLVVANPAAGQRTPILAPLNDAWRGKEANSPVDWEVLVTSGDRQEDEQRVLQVAQRMGATCVAACGGDGTQRLVASVIAKLPGLDPVLLVLPTGTGNALAAELQLPTSLTEAASLLLTPDRRLVHLPLGKVDDELFMLRVSWGFPAAIPLRAERLGKGALGYFAYVVAALQEIDAPRASRYWLRIDGGEPEEVEALGLVLTNFGALGSGLRLPVDVQLEDPHLELVVMDGLWKAVAASVQLQTLERRTVCRTLQVEVAEPVCADVDGESVEFVPHIIELTGARVRVVAPSQT